MRRITLFATLALVLSAFGAYALRAQESVADRIAALPAVKDVQELESTKFPEKYLVIFEQPIDHEDPAKGTFTQRVVVGIVHPDSATVVVTEGYGAQYAFVPSYRDEISTIFNTNNIVVEHRYFLESTPYPGKAPEDVNWDYMNAPNAAADMHEVVTALKSILDGKWISTGISKGGMTCMFYRAYFPNDVEVSVPYVAPLNKAPEDGRHETFLEKTVGTPKERACITDFQIEILKRKDRLMPLFDALCQQKNYQFNVSTREIYDYCVLEFPFAYWQWGKKVHQLPDLNNASDQELFDFFIQNSSPDYFQPLTGNLSFFYQAAHELGYYGYDVKPLKPYIELNSAKDYLTQIMLPKELQETPFSNKVYKYTVNYLKKNDPKMIFIYGENDPWTASGVCTWLNFDKKENMKCFLDPCGSHVSRINTLPSTLRNEVIALIKKWME